MKYGTDPTKEPQGRGGHSKSSTIAFDIIHTFQKKLCPGIMGMKEARSDLKVTRMIITLFTNNMEKECSFSDETIN